MGSSKFDSYIKDASTEQVSPKEYLQGINEESKINLREKMVLFLLVSYGFLILTTMSIFFLQGFNAFGFKLDVNTLAWLGGATIGEIGGLLALVYGSLFKDK